MTAIKYNAPKTFAQRQVKLGTFGHSCNIMELMIKTVY